jgi:polar amino acid transport system substrate-binding protein
VTSKLRRILLFVLVLCVPHAAFSDDLKPLNVAVGLSLPPYVIAQEKRGMEYDIVREALADAGYELVPVFMDFGDVLDAMSNQQVDAAMTYPGDLHVAATLSQVHITYHNQAMTLASRGLEIEATSDLAGKSVIAFQNARSYLPDPYRATVEASTIYSEVPEQYLQNLGLFTGDYEVAVADINIFNWFTDDPRVTSAGDSDQAIAYHDIFPPTPYHVAFQDHRIRDAFDVALTAMKESGRYQEIIESYGGVQ